MPANLTPQYLEAERNFRQAKTTLEKIACLEDMLAVIPRHKGTEHLQADLDDGSRNFQELQSRYGARLPVIAISALGIGLDELKKQIFQVLDVIRVYTKEPGGKPDMAEPILLERGSTLEMAAASIHKSFAMRMKYPRIWGSGKFDGVAVKRDHVLQDGDIIELHL
jgi:ribosome-interacting GTPase 1